MTAKELIENLQLVNPNTPVRVRICAKTDIMREMVKKAEEEKDLWCLDVDMSITSNKIKHIGGINQLWIEFDIKAMENETCI